MFGCPFIDVICHTNAITVNISSPLLLEMLETSEITHGRRMDTTGSIQRREVGVRRMRVRVLMLMLMMMLIRRVRRVRRMRLMLRVIRLVMLMFRLFCVLLLCELHILRRWRWRRPFHDTPHDEATADEQRAEADNTRELEERRVGRDDGGGRGSRRGHAGGIRIRIIHRQLTIASGLETTSGVRVWTAA